MVELLGKPLIFGDVEQIKERKRLEKEAERKLIECKECNGCGIIEVDCRDCNGTGEDPKKKESLKVKKSLEESL